MPLLIESVVSAAPSPVMKQPDGVAFAEVSPDICFCLIPVVIAALFLLPPVGFAIVTLVVCMLAAWEWGQLSGFTTRSQRVWLAVLCGLLLALMLFCCRNITEIFINRWLKSHFGLRWVGGVSRYCWCCFTRVPQQSGVTLKHCALFWRANHCSLLLGHAGVTGPALRRESLQWRNMAALCHDPGMGR